METYRKIDNYNLEVTKVAPTPDPVVRKYERSFIENQIIAITKDRDHYVALRNAELAECMAIITEMNKLNIVAKAKEDIKL